MKTKLTILITLLILLVSCDDILDKNPRGLYYKDLVWSDSRLIDNVLINCYSMMSMYNEMQLGANHFGYTTNDITITATNIADEATAYWIQTPKSHWITVEGGVYEYWNYPVVRELNLFLQNLENAPVDDNFKTQRSSEARFLRAYAYFNMVKRYGGVPLILKAQTLNDTHEELYPKREKEENIYRFIIQEMNDIITNKLLPLSYTNNDTGRPTIWAAAALKSRAALYAASIATWGDVKLEGLIGIPNSEKNYFWQQSLEASNFIINEGPFVLYNAELPNYTKNYRNIFLVKDNSEVIFAEKFLSYTGKGHSWDHWQNPRGYNSWGGGQGSCVYLEMVESYENIDGSNPKIDRNKILAGHLWTMDELFGKKDPRFKASIYTQDSPWSHYGSPLTLDYHSGILKPDGSVTLESYDGIQPIGYSQQNPWPTPFGILKYLDESIAMAGDRGFSITDWILFRLGEIYLNKAEAEFELGNEEAARNSVNEIRKRAGMPQYNSPITLDEIRRERKIELAFEGNRYFDVRRWRTAVKDLSNAYHGLRYILDAESYGSGTQKYKVEITENVAGSNPVPYFENKHYYLPISKSRTTANPNLVENPEYK